MNKNLIMVLVLSFCFITTSVVVILTCGHKHTFDGKYCYDEQYHYEVCECGERKSKEEHKIVIDEYVAPTCLTDGLTQGSHCSVCGYITQAQQVIQKSDEYHNIEHYEYVAPTCTTDGHTEYEECINGCGYSTYQKIDKLEHKYLTWEHLEGTKTHKSVCQNNESHIEIEECDFEVLEIVNPTCDKQGYSILKCKKCGYICNDNYTDATGHTITFSDPIYGETPCEYDVIITCVDCLIELGTEHYIDHLWGNWEHIEGTETHKRVCQNDENHFEIEDCNKVFEFDDTSYTKYVCDKCGQDYYEYKQPTGMKETKNLTLIIPDNFENKRKIK